VVAQGTVAPPRSCGGIQPADDRRQARCAEYPSQLIEPIAGEIAKVPRPSLDDPAQSAIAPEELTSALDEIGWDFNEATQRLAGARSALARLLDGRSPVSVAVAQYLDKVLAVIRAHPSRPEGWGDPD